MTFKSVRSDNIFLALETGEKPINKKVIKSTLEKSIFSLIETSSPNQKIITIFQEINKSWWWNRFWTFWKFVGKTDKYLPSNFKPVFNVVVTEQIVDTKGELVEERKPNYLNSNINESSIVKWTNKYIPKSKLYNKVVLRSKYQIKHVNGLTFDFLFKIAKDLHTKHSFMMVGGGKGDEPLVLYDGGKPFRGFLEGRIKEDSYCLILHLSDQEFKGLNDE